MTLCFFSVALFSSFARKALWLSQQSNFRANMLELQRTILATNTQAMLKAKSDTSMIVGGIHSSSMGASMYMHACSFM